MAFSKSTRGFTNIGANALNKIEKKQMKRESSYTSTKPKAYQKLPTASQ